MPQMEPIQQKEDAHTRLERQRDTMIELWGPEYKSHPSYRLAVRDVEKGRHPTYALADFQSSE